MNVTTLESIPDIKLIAPRVFRDERGYFFESFAAGRYEQHGIAGPFVQDNISFSARGVIRGLHYQWPHNAQGKLVSVSYGRVWDVAADIRVDSPTFGRWIGIELSAENCLQLWIPPGFAHGFAVMSESAVFCYKCTAPYSPSDERSIRWDDPTLSIDWPVASPLLSPKDTGAPLLQDIAAKNLPRL